METFKLRLITTLTAGLLISEPAEHLCMLAVPTSQLAQQSRRTQ